MELRAVSPPITCAVCRARLEVPWSACERCRTALHQECWELLDLACPTRGCRRPRPAIRLRLPRSSRPRRWPWVVAALLGVAGAAALALSQIEWEAEDTIIIQGGGWGGPPAIANAGLGDPGWEAEMVVAPLRLSRIEQDLSRLEGVAEDQVRRIVHGSVREARALLHPRCTMGDLERRSIVRAVCREVARLSMRERTSALDIEDGPILSAEGIGLGMGRSAVVVALGLAPDASDEELSRVAGACGLILRFEAGRLVELRVILWRFCALGLPVGEYRGLLWGRLGPATQPGDALAMLGSAHRVDAQVVRCRRGAVSLELVFPLYKVGGLGMVVARLD